MMRLSVFVFVLLTHSHIANAFDVGDRIAYEGVDQEGAPCGLSFTVESPSPGPANTEQLRDIRLFSKRTADYANAKEHLVQRRSGSLEGTYFWSESIRRSPDDDPYGWQLITFREELVLYGNTLSSLKTAEIITHRFNKAHTILLCHELH